jgi:CheY-like chemotaxis protein
MMPEPKHLHILVVDDSKLNRKMLIKILKADGHSCDEAEDGKQAVDMVRASLTGTQPALNRTQPPIEITPTYDTILMDFMMPVMNGSDATAEIRKMGYEGPIFGVTGNALPEDQLAFLASGVDRVLVKPLDPDLIPRLFAGNVL